MSNWELNINPIPFFLFIIFWGSIAQLINKLVDKESLAGHSCMCSIIGGYCFFQGILLFETTCTLYWGGKRLKLYDTTEEFHWKNY